jgi:hypothetical protein
MQAFGRDMAVFAFEQQARQGNPLAGGAQTGLAKASGEVGAGTGHCDAHM